jgi:hypothetical protein
MSLDVINASFDGLVLLCCELLGWKERLVVSSLDDLLLLLVLGGARPETILLLPTEPPPSSHFRRDRSMMFARQSTPSVLLK